MWPRSPSSSRRGVDGNPASLAPARLLLLFLRRRPEVLPLSLRPVKAFHIVLLRGNDTLMMQLSGPCRWCCAIAYMSSRTSSYPVVELYPGDSCWCLFASSSKSSIYARYECTVCDIAYVLQAKKVIVATREKHRIAGCAIGVVGSHACAVQHRSTPTSPGGLIDVTCWGWLGFTGLHLLRATLAEMSQLGTLCTRR